MTKNTKHSGGRKRTGGLAPRGTGTIERIGEHLFVRVSLPDHTRPRVRLCDQVCHCQTMSPARARATADHIAEKERERVAGQLEQQSRRERGRRLTVKEFGEQWTSGKLTNGTARSISSGPKRRLGTTIAGSVSTSIRCSARRPWPT
jgi:hypothetical protein